MTTKLSTTLCHIKDIPNAINRELVQEFHQYLVGNCTSDAYRSQMIKIMNAYGNYIGANVTFYQVTKQEQIISFLDTKIKSPEVDPDQKWIITWNDYRWRIVYFFRWLHNSKVVVESGTRLVDPSDWVTPAFAKIKKKKTKRLSPYSADEIWDKDEILTIVKYEPNIRNKAILTLLWDLDARNREITLLKRKNVRLKERYAEGEIPHQAKTGGGPILLTCSFPYVRDMLNVHPFRNEPNASLIYNMLNGAAITSDQLWNITRQLKNRIIRLLDTGAISDENEKRKLEFFVRTKKWNPYCIRHSAISSDSDILPHFALNKKVRWSMNSRQPARYIKNRMSSQLKKQLLVHNGIIPPNELKTTPSVLNCPKCQLVNASECKYCSKCSYPLIPEAYEEIKAEEDRKLKLVEERFNSRILDIERKQDEKCNMIQDKFNLLLMKNIQRYADMLRDGRIDHLNILRVKDAKSIFDSKNWANFVHTQNGIKLEEQTVLPFNCDNPVDKELQTDFLQRELNKLTHGWGIKFEPKIENR